MSSSSDSDTSTGSSPYVSDDEVKYCKSRCNSINSDTYTDDIPGFVAEALDESERTEIATISEQRMKTSGDRFYPKKLKTYMQENEWNIYQQIINEVTEQKGWVFAAPSILQIISQCGHQKPRGVRYDVCHCSPGKPLKVLTFTSEDDSENRYVRYNARLTSMIINHIEQDIGQPLSAVYGVIDRTKHASDEEFGKRIRVLEIAAQKTSLPQTLHVDGHIYRKMTKSLLDLFSTTYPSRMTASQETDNIPSLNFKQSKMADSMTDDDKDHGTDTGDKRALSNKEESLVAMPVAPIQHKVTESITDDEKRHGTDTDDKRDLQNKETSYVGMLVAAVRNMFQKQGSQDEAIDHQKKFEWNTKANFIWTKEELEKKVSAAESANQVRKVQVEKLEAERIRKEREEARVLKQKEEELRRTEALLKQQKEASLAKERKAEKERLEALEAKENKRQSEEVKQLEIDEERMRFNWGPKRPIDWTEENYTRLKNNCLRDRKDDNGKNISLKILLFGPMSCGKSTLCNGFRSALQGEPYVSNYYAAASRGESMTKGFRFAKYGDHYIVDMSGTRDSDSITNDNIRNIATGKVSFSAQLSETLAPADESESLSQTQQHEVSCIVLVLKTGYVLEDGIRRQINLILELAGAGDVTFHLVLTHLDECDRTFLKSEQLPNLFRSLDVQGEVKRISEETGIPAASISFVRNYFRDTETDLHTNILLLRVLDKIMFDAYEQFISKRTSMGEGDQKNT